MKIKFCLTLLIILTYFHFTPEITHAQYTNLMSISADLDNFDIEIKSNFEGAKIMIFGTKTNEIDNFLISLLGPNKKYLIAKKEKILGLWLKKKIMIFEDVPSYYACWASEDLLKEEKKFLLSFYDFGLSNLNFNINDLQKYNEQTIYEFKNALIKYMKKRKLYHDIKPILPSNNNLFKINSIIPDNASVGNYLVNLKSLSGKNFIVENEISMSFKVFHLNLNKFLNTLNNQYSKTYAIFLIIIAFTNVYIIKWIFTRF